MAILIAIDIDIDREHRYRYRGRYGYYFLLSFKTSANRVALKGASRVPHDPLRMLYAIDGSEPTETIKTCAAEGAHFAQSADIAGCLMRFASFT